MLLICHELSPWATELAMQSEPSLSPRLLIQLPVVPERALSSESSGADSLSYIDHLTPESSRELIEAYRAGITSKRTIKSKQQRNSSRKEAQANARRQGSDGSITFGQRDIDAAADDELHARLQVINDEIARQKQYQHSKVSIFNLYSKLHLQHDF